MAISAAHRAAIMEARVFEGQVDLLRMALEEIIKEVGTSTKANKIAREALRRLVGREQQP